MENLSRQLRIGNLVNPNFPMKVVGIYQDEILADFEGNEGDVYEYKKKDLKPIELTEDWLLKMGFEIEEIHAGLSEADFGHNPITQDFILTIKNTGSGWFYRNGYFKIEFVHQLQNLYHSLTGEELIIK